MKHTFSKVTAIVAAVVLIVSLLLDPAAAEDASSPAKPSGSAASFTPSSSKKQESGTSEESNASEIESETESSSSEPVSKKASSSRKANVKSSNSRLKSLRVRYHTLLPKFDPSVTTYGVLVAYDVTALTIYATPQDDDASVRIRGNYKDLSVGVNTIRVVVTAENGSQRTYTIKAKRQAQNGGIIDSAALSAYLAGLESQPAVSSSASKSDKNESGSKWPPGMRALVAVAVVSGLMVFGTVTALVKHNRRMKRLRQKCARQNSQNLNRPNRR